MEKFCSSFSLVEWQCSRRFRSETPSVLVLLPSSAKTRTGENSPRLRAVTFLRECVARIGTKSVQLWGRASNLIRKSCGLCAGISVNAFQLFAPAMYTSIYVAVVLHWKRLFDVTVCYEFSAFNVTSSSLSRCIVNFFLFLYRADREWQNVDPCSFHHRCFSPDRDNLDESNDKSKQT